MPAYDPYGGSSPFYVVFDERSQILVRGLPDGDTLPMSLIPHANNHN